MPRTPTELLTIADQARRASLRRMKAVALGALILMAALFVAGFAFEDAVPAMAYLRAAAEGGMVGALADWFAVTALFRHPLGLPIPHTAIIPSRKDEIGRTLGEFVETNFLSSPVVREKLGSARMAERAGTWLAQPEHAERGASEGAAMAQGVLRALSDDDVQELVASLAREHLIEPEWGTPAGASLRRVVASGAHRAAVDLAADSVAGWLRENSDAFAGLVSRRLPSWLPSVAHRVIDGALYNEAVSFVDAVRADHRHPARAAIDRYLARLADNLQHDEDTRAKLEAAKTALFDSPRVRELAASAWDTAKNGLIASLGDESSALRTRIREALMETGERLQSDAPLRQRVDGWVMDAAGFLVERYRHDIASIITDTVEKWDAEETTEKIELLVGRDLQYIRLNGTVVGALAGLVIFAVAHAVFG